MVRAVTAASSSKNTWGRVSRLKVSRFESFQQPRGVLRYQEPGPGEIGLKGQAPECNVLKREVAGRLGCGLLGPRGKGPGTGALMISSRNWRALSARPRMSKHRKYRRKKRHN